jgi:hypothetical protein
MKIASTPLTACLLFLAIASAAHPRVSPTQTPEASASRTPVVLELFTSEGCSSCPPADALLIKLGTQQPVPDAEIIVLEEHVDYWDHDGWVDPFSSPEWTARQEEYVTKFKGKTSFTPQMLVNGQEFSGTEQQALSVIGTAAHGPVAEITVTPEASAAKDTQRFSVRVDKVPETADHDSADIWLAVTETGLQTAVKAGENAGRDLRHSAVLHSLNKIGSVKTGSGASAFASSQKVSIKPNWKRENLRVVVFVQGRKSLSILGAASVKVD